MDGTGAKNLSICASREERAESANFAAGFTTRPLQVVVGGGERSAAGGIFSSGVTIAF